MGEFITYLIEIIYQFYCFYILYYYHYKYYTKVYNRTFRCINLLYY